MDIVQNSLLVREYGTKTMEKLYFQLRRFLDRKLADYDGRVWNWAGGILAFTFAGNVNRAVKCAIDIQTSLPLFNISPENPVNRRVALRTAVDTGRVRFTSDTGRISISERVMAKTDSKIMSIFTDAGQFEGFPYCTTTRPLDLLFADAEGCEEDEATA